MKEYIHRDVYLQRLINRQRNGLIKVITGIRRSGKSFLLSRIFRQHLAVSGVDEAHIIEVALDDERNESLLDRHQLGEYVRSRLEDGDDYYLFLDEVQRVEGFESVLNGLNRIENLDIYVTGSNSKFLSSDVITEFRGRGDEVHVQPLTFAEYCQSAVARPRPTTENWQEYLLYGGLPQVAQIGPEEEKATFLKNLFKQVYLRDILDRHNLREDAVLSDLVNLLASNIGGLTNPTRLAKAFQSRGYAAVSDKTLSSYLSFLEDAFMISKATRWDIKGKKYLASPFKYYFADSGIRNTVLNFR